MCTLFPLIYPVSPIDSLCSFSLSFVFCSSDWIISIDLSSRSLIHCFVCFSLPLKFSIIQYQSLYSLQLQNFCLVLYLFSISLLNFSSCACIFLIPSDCLFVFSCSWVSLEQLFIILCWAIPGSPFLWGQFMTVYCIPHSSWSLKPCVGVCIWTHGRLSQTLWSDCGKGRLLPADGACWGVLWPQVELCRAPTAGVCGGTREWGLLGSDCWDPQHRQLCGPWWVLQGSQWLQVFLGPSVVPSGPAARDRGLIADTHIVVGTGERARAGPTVGTLALVESWPSVLWSDFYKVSWSVFIN